MATSTADLIPFPKSTFGPTGLTTDTIVVAYGGQQFKVRYIGMDAPETSDPNSSIEWMGPEATLANTNLVDGKTVFLEKDVSEVDRYDRILLPNVTRHTTRAFRSSATWTALRSEPWARRPLLSSARMTIALIATATAWVASPRLLPAPVGCAYDDRR